MTSWNTRTESAELSKVKERLTEIIEYCEEGQFAGELADLVDSWEDFLATIKEP